MNRFLAILFSFIFLSCSQFNKGVIAKGKLRKKKPPSVQIAEEYDKKAKKSNKTYSNPKRAERARLRQSKRHKRKGDRYLKKQRRKLK